MTPPRSTALPIDRNRVPRYFIVRADGTRQEIAAIAGKSFRLAEGEKLAVVRPGDEPPATPVAAAPPPEVTSN